MNWWHLMPILQEAVLYITKNGGGSVKVFHSLAIPAPSTCPYATVNTEKSSIECTLNDDNARMSREILLHLQTSFFLNAYVLIPITI